MSYEAITNHLRACNAAADVGAAYPAMDGLTVPEQARVTHFLSFANPDGRGAPETRHRSTTQAGPSHSESPGGIGGGNRAALETYLANLASITQEGEQ
jgi:hypothetical protein